MDTLKRSYKKKERKKKEREKEKRKKKEGKKKGKKGRKEENTLSCRARVDLVINMESGCTHSLLETLNM